MEHPENRVDDDIEMVTERVRRLEENAKDANNDGTTAAYMRQIELLTADFYRERREREKLACKMGDLQLLLKHQREKYQTLYHEVLAIQNGSEASTRTERAYKE